ncbi:MAG TPA: hypothetical protein V6D13_01920 [Halomicronema sp.]|jgi:hypothetical protein
MSHTFLIESGRWTLEGTWLERNAMPIPVKGKTLVAWNQDNWFTMVTKLVFPGSEREEITFQYRGHLDEEERLYTFVLQHSELGKVEGEGWIAPQTIVQRYWVLGDKERRSGFEVLHRLDNNKYFHSSGIMAGHYLTSTMEATYERQRN